MTIILSIFSFYFIEKIFRNKNIISVKILVIFLLSSILFLFLFSFYIIKGDGIKKRFPEIFDYKLPKIDIKYYQNNNLQKVLLIGDSHAGVLEYQLNEELKKNELSLFRFETPMFLGDFNYIDIKTKKIDQQFIINNSKIRKFIEENSNLIIVFHQRWSLRILETHFDNEEGFKEYFREGEKYYDYLEPVDIKTTSHQQRVKYIKEGLISEIQKIINQGHKLILVYPVPEMGFEPYKLLSSEYLKKFKFTKEKYSPSIFSGNYDVYKKRNKLSFDILDSVFSENIYRVYPHEFFCDKQIKNRCVANDEKNIFYYDDDHLSIHGSKFLVNDIVKIIKNIQ